MPDVEVTRLVSTGRPPEELWAMIGDSARWSEWMVDRADLVVEPGAGGIVHDRGAVRTVQVDHVDEDGRRLAFRWWPIDDEGPASTVELVVLPSAAGSTLQITERFAAPASVASAAASDPAAAGIAWDVRTLLLVLATGHRLVATA